MWSDLVDLFARNETVLWTTVGVSLSVFVGSLLLMPFLVARIPSDYFVSHERPPSWLDEQTAAVRGALQVAKNGLGLVLLVAGLSMLVLPGQGLLTIFAALILLEFPGKRRLELAVVRRPRVLGALNWLRRRAARPPLAPPHSP